MLMHPAVCTYTSQKQEGVENAAGHDKTAWYFVHFCALSGVQAILSNPEKLAYMKDRIPLKRLGEPEDIVGESVMLERQLQMRGAAGLLVLVSYWLCMCLCAAVQLCCSACECWKGGSAVLLRFCCRAAVVELLQVRWCS
jgi:hypothetical protein